MALTPSFTHACGALGRYDPSRLAAIISAAEAELRIVHEDGRSAVALDREPVRWAGRRTHGLAWSELPARPGTEAIRSWEEMATAGAGCGLVLRGRDRHLHSSVSGIAPLYYLAEGGAVYFSTRIDPLAASSPRRLSVDWEAWSAILTLGYPLGDRTPFAEIRRLGAYSLLRCRRGRAEASVERWPWAEVEPRVEVAEGAGEVLERLRDSIARIPAGLVACQLSGGLDSRLCLALLAERRREDVRAITVDHDAGTDRELRVAARIAEVVGVPHEEVTGTPSEYWPELISRTARVDYQFVHSPWRMPVLHAIRRIPGTVIDGFGFDVFAGPSRRYFTPEALVPAGDRSTVRALWSALNAKQAERGIPPLRSELARELRSAARRRLLAESNRFEGHPARTVLTFYLGRQARGIGLAVHSVLGAESPVAMALVDDRVARGALSISLQSKRDARLHLELLERLDPRLARRPSTRHGAIGEGRPLPMRSRSEPVAEAVLAAVERGPLSPWIQPKALRRVSRHRRGLPPRAPVALLGPAIFHLWERRYRDLIGEVDVGAALGLTPAGTEQVPAAEERVP